MSIEPLKLAPGNSLELQVGEAVPAAELLVLDGHRRRITRAFMGGQMQALEVTQRLWRLTGSAAAPPPPELAAGRRGRCASIANIVDSSNE